MSPCVLFNVNFLGHRQTPAQIKQSAGNFSTVTHFSP